MARVKKMMVSDVINMCKGYELISIIDNESYYDDEYYSMVVNEWTTVKQLFIVDEINRKSDRYFENLEVINISTEVVETEDGHTYCKLNIFTKKTEVEI